MLTPFEVATHVVLGRDPAAAETLAGTPVPATPLAAFEQELRGALRRPPCLVGFSGGRDSSTVLAAATSLARAEGLPAPVPVTLRFGGASAAQEDEWQESLISHLGVGDWLRLTLGDEADLVGPTAAALMDRHGLSYPYNTHLVAPMVSAAHGGTLVTGLGGDEALSPGSHALAVLARHRPPAPRDVLSVGFAVAPRRLRSRVLERRRPLRFPWLQPDANRRLAREWSEDVAARPLRRDRALLLWWTERYLQLTMRSLARLGADEDVELRHPFATPSFVAALARQGGPTGFRSRADAIGAVFGDLVPIATARRATKASFDAVLWNRHTQVFVAGLRAEPARLAAALGALGLEETVDAGALAAHWAEACPRANSFLLLQACWLTERTSATPSR